MAEGLNGGGGGGGGGGGDSGLDYWNGTGLFSMLKVKLTFMAYCLQGSLSKTDFLPHNCRTRDPYDDRNSDYC